MKSLVLAGLSLALLVIPATRVERAAGAPARGSASQAGLSYHWPVRPFDRPHPIRGAFGDPRIVSTGDPFGWTGADKIAAHSFHNGVDIVASPGTPVYPVVSGRVAHAKPGEIVIETNDGRTFQYYHLSKARAVKPGKLVVVDRTVLGWIRTTYGHVHLAEIDNHLVHNPLDRGHLEPYYDHTKPVATDLYVDDGSLPSSLDGRAVGARDRLSVDASDRPSMRLPDEWTRSAQVPALVEWRLFHKGTRTPWKVAVDLRRTQPPPRDFWEVYGAGTYQNSPTFKDRIYHGVTGRYLVRLRIHPDKLKPGVYRLAVRVSDTRGNRSTTWWPLQIAR